MAGRGRGAANKNVPKAFISRAQASKLVGLTPDALRKMEGVRLSPITIGGAVYYHRSEIDGLVMSRDGDAARDAFRLFVEGKGPVAVVCELGLPVEAVQRLWACYQNMLELEGRTLVIEFPENVQVASWLRAHGLPEPLPAKFVQRALEAVARSPELVRRLVGE